ncbi:unnamed protein product [Amoebophrya sp. A25]|nr:unnamed protein product [Amoebophrya sp. A25]|eukprot:GSA25T00018047001.1
MPPDDEIGDQTASTMLAGRESVCVPADGADVPSVVDAEVAAAEDSGSPSNTSKPASVNASPVVEPPKPRKYRFSIAEPESFESDFGNATSSRNSRVSTRLSSRTSEVQQLLLPPSILAARVSATLRGEEANLLDNSNGRMRGSVFMLEPTASTASGTRTGSEVPPTPTFDDGDLELLKGRNSGSRSVSKSSSSSSLGEDASFSEPIGLAPFAPFNADSVAHFPSVVAEIAHEASLLSVVCSSRYEALRKKRVEKPEAFQTGSFGARLLGQFSDALQTGAYVLGKTKYMLHTQVLDLRGERKPVKPMLNREFDPQSQVDEALRSVHGASSKIACLAEDIATTVIPTKRKSNLQQTSIGRSSGSSMFGIRFKEFYEQGFETRRKLEEPVSSVEFLQCMEQFYALKGHFESVISKSNTLMRILDTQLDSQTTSIGATIKVAVAASKLKGLLNKSKQGVDERAMAS